MSNELHELSTGDLEEVSGGIYRNFTPGPSITPSIPIPPPVLGSWGPARSSLEGTARSVPSPLSNARS